MVPILYYGKQEPSVVSGSDNVNGTDHYNSNLFVERPRQQGCCDGATVGAAWDATDARSRPESWRTSTLQLPVQ